NIALGSGSTTRPSTSMAPSFLPMSSPFRALLRGQTHTVLHEPCSRDEHDGIGATGCATGPVYALIVTRRNQPPETMKCHPNHHHPSTTRTSAGRLCRAERSSRPTVGGREP